MVSWRYDVGILDKIPMGLHHPVLIFLIYQYFFDTQTDLSYTCIDPMVAQISGSREPGFGLPLEGAVLLKIVQVKSA